MEPQRERKRVFNDCGKGHPLGQCDCPAARTEFEALEEYMLICTQIGMLELRENECKCGEFYTCDLCTESAGLSHRAAGLMNLWGDNWASRLWAILESRGDKPLATKEGRDG